MLASVIICTRNRSVALKETLLSFNSLVIPDGLTVEIIVVDNGSTDQTSEVTKSIRLAQFNVHHVLENAPGQAMARNTGVQFAAGDLIIFTDDDVKPTQRWLEAITEPILKNRFDAVAGSVRIAPDLLRPWMTERHRAWLSSTEYLNPEAPETGVGANMAFKRLVLDQVPRFDSELGPGRLGFWDDTLFFSQLKRAGFRLGMATDAVVEHHFDSSRLTRSSFVTRATGEGRSLAYVAWHWKHENRSCPWLRASRRELELQLKRRLRANEWPHSDGLPVWEMDLIKGIAFLRHFATVQQQPRAYEKFGLRKRF